jgi:hypothetical protein
LRQERRFFPLFSRGHLHPDILDPFGAFLAVSKIVLRLVPDGPIRTVPGDLPAHLSRQALILRRMKWR